MVLFPYKATRRTRWTLFLIHASLLVGFLALGAGFGPFTDPDSGIAVSVGMVGVAAMATQNALVRLELPVFPSTAVMTTNITQLTIDLALVIRGKGDPSDAARARRGARLTFPSVIGFVAGCAAGGFLELHFGLLALALPVVLAAVAIPLGAVFSGGFYVRVYY